MVCLLSCNTVTMRDPIGEDGLEIIRLTVVAEDGYYTN